jgi:RNA polymerase sigma factor (sigma-70 family)
LATLPLERETGNGTIFEVEISDPNAETEGDLADRIDRESLSQRVADCLGSLSRVEQKAITMRYLDEATDETIARTLGVPLPRVRVTRHRALKKLKKCLGNAGS